MTISHTLYNAGNWVESILPRLSPDTVVVKTQERRLYRERRRANQDRYATHGTNQRALSLISSHTAAFGFKKGEVDFALFRFHRLSIQSNAGASHIAATECFGTNKKRRLHRARQL